MRKRTRAVILAVCGVGMVGSSLQAWSLGRGNWQRGFRRQAEELGLFVRASLSARNDLLIVERFRDTMRSCDDVVWIFIQDPAGRITFSNNASELGTVLDSPRAKTAGGARETLVQRGPGSGRMEVDVPLGTHGVLRMAGAPRSLGKAEEWLLITLLFGAAGLLVAAWLLFGQRAEPPPREPVPAG